MNVRIIAPVYTCECNSAMLFLEGVEVPRRRMVCCNLKCAHNSQVVLEPVFAVEMANQVETV